MTREGYDHDRVASGGRRACPYPADPSRSGAAGRDAARGVGLRDLPEVRLDPTGGCEDADDDGAGIGDRAAKGLALGADGFISKPFELKDLRERCGASWTARPGRPVAPEQGTWMLKRLPAAAGLPDLRRPGGRRWLRSVIGLWLGYPAAGPARDASALCRPASSQVSATLGLIAGSGTVRPNVAKPIDTLAGALRARAHADVAARWTPRSPAIWATSPLPPTAAAQSLRETRSALAEAVARETLRLGRRRRGWRRCLSDVPVGVLLCTADHQMVFYNAPAADVLGSGAGLGLDRRLTRLPARGPLRLRHDRLLATGDADAASDLMCTTAGRRARACGPDAAALG